MSSVEAAALRDRAAGLRRAAASAQGFEVSALFASDGARRVAMSAITSLVASSTALATFVTSAGADR